MIVDLGLVEVSTWRSAWWWSATGWPASAPSRRFWPEGAETSSTITVFGDEPYGNYNRILLSNVLAGMR